MLSLHPSLSTYSIQLILLFSLFTTLMTEAHRAPIRPNPNLLLDSTDTECQQWMLSLRLSVSTQLTLLFYLSITLICEAPPAPICPNSNLLKMLQILFQHRVLHHKLTFRVYISITLIS